jgi:hypothetical protein
LNCKKCLKDKKIICRGLCKSCYKQVRYIELSIPTKKCKCGDPLCTEIIPIKNVNGKPRKYARGHHRKKDNNRSPYKVLFVPDHPNSNKLGRIYEHRLVMSQFLGRPLQRGEVVHHINGNKRDNRIENLQIFDTHKKHISETTRRPPKNVKCEICDSNETYLDERQRPIWRGYGDSAFICDYCFHLYWQYTCFGNRDILDYNKKPKKDFSGTLCSICGSENTYIMKNGRPDWRHYDGNIICKSCCGKLRYRKQ